MTQFLGSIFITEKLIKGSISVKKISKFLIVNQTSRDLKNKSSEKRKWALWFTLKRSLITECLARKESHDAACQKQQKVSLLFFFFFVFPLWFSGQPNKQRSKGQKNSLKTYIQIIRKREKKNYITLQQAKLNPWFHLKCSSCESAKGNFIHKLHEKWPYVWYVIFE